MGNSASAGNGSPSPVKLAHAVFRTRDNYEAMVKWWALVLNARIVFDSPFLTFLTYDDEHHRIAIAHAPDLSERDGRRVGLDHLAFTYADLDALMATFERLKAAGIEPFCPVNHGPTTSLYYLDPDGNRIELQIDNFKDLEEVDRHIARNFLVNPLGLEFEPELMAARLHGGADADELIRMPADLPPPSPALIGKLFAG